VRDTHVLTSGTEQNVAAKLLQLLGYLPLAIEQAGAYISVQRQSLSHSGSQALRRYLDTYKKNAKSLLQEHPRRSVWGYRNDTVFTTWEVSFNAIRKEAPRAAELLLSCGFVARSDIFEDMFRYGRNLPENGTCNPLSTDIDHCSTNSWCDRRIYTNPNPSVVLLFARELQGLG
jgi:hypothetical protein